ncbi:hypothetical protein TorRG33x02_245100 [Trema orientale]|uniref:Uncharacterized protein n=1 Tax=Trema orientale TaxID=63057 RepID=A0A2P5DQ59_TREOI|nr:hypothetical protein TorRG33x02_245100 [Trema orientale]
MIGRLPALPPLFLTFSTWSKIFDRGRVRFLRRNCGEEGDEGRLTLFPVEIVKERCLA